MINEMILDEKLNELGYSESHLGTRYLRRAVALVDCTPYARMMDIYKQIAAEEGTSGSAVERCIRHASEAAFQAAGWEPTAGFYGNCIAEKMRVTNAEAVARLARACHEN